MATKETYIVHETPQGMIQQMNFIMAQIAGRLDIIEGLTGDAVISNNIILSGGITTNSKKITTDYTLTVTDSKIYVDTTAQAVTVTWNTDLLIAGRKLRIQDSGGNTPANKITIQQGGSETMNGNKTIDIFEPYNSITFTCDGVNLFF